MQHNKALEYHASFPQGKIQIMPTKRLKDPTDLALAYTPGIATPCQEIAKDIQKAYTYTGKGNLVAICTNGTAVLGLKNIGPVAAKPVMEGKALLFKMLAGIDAFDLEIQEEDPDKLVSIINALTPTFGGINLEDIQAPQCFDIEQNLQKISNIPVMHDDQHATAIVVSAKTPQCTTSSKQKDQKHTHRHLRCRSKCHCHSFTTLQTRSPKIKPHHV